MLVGHVQSGKTANYTGLICKAADAGYRLIIVIAGIHNNLRNQTQMRIDEGCRQGQRETALQPGRSGPAFHRGGPVRQIAPAGNLHQLDQGFQQDAGIRRRRSARQPAGTGDLRDQEEQLDAEEPDLVAAGAQPAGRNFGDRRAHPDTVSKGAQKNFAHFAGKIGSEWKKQPDAFNEEFYRQAIAKALIFRATEEIVTEQSWYQGGYRANVVAYAIAKMSHDCEQREEFVDYDSIWRAQGISEEMGAALALVAEGVHEVLVSPPTGISNVTEWAKQQACWARVKALEIDWPEAWLGELIGKDRIKEGKRAGIKDQKLLNGIEAQSVVVSAGGQLWAQLSAWGQSRKLLSPTELGILRVAASVPMKIPSEKQCLKVIESLRKLRAEGCPIGSEIAL